MISAAIAMFALTGVLMTSAQATPVPCSTWQYNTDDGKPIYSSGAGYDLVGYTASDGFVNVTGFSGDFRYGNFYNSSGQRYQTEKWIHLTHIHYVRCW
ncbi:hypothetical protein [Lentzea xinjiangensis]|uniref:hypothetical protein n=1 Tax=Lentzea xinjiangensis TaxID=402600 RepID=UPI000B7E5DF5|nr:hypothetical protein [Lentzea xinjiangensis]